MHENMKIFQKLKICLAALIVFLTLFAFSTAVYSAPKLVKLTAGKQYTAYDFTRNKKKDKFKYTIAGKVTLNGKSFKITANSCTMYYYSYNTANTFLLVDSKNSVGNTIKIYRYASGKFVSAGEPVGGFNYAKPEKVSGDLIYFTTGPAKAASTLSFKKNTGGMFRYQETYYVNVKKHLIARKSNYGQITAAKYYYYSGPTVKLSSSAKTYNQDGGKLTYGQKVRLHRVYFQYTGIDASKGTKIYEIEFNGKKRWIKENAKVTFVSRKPEDVSPGSTAGVAGVSCGGLHTAILKKDGTLWMCGQNVYGQFGNGKTYTYKNTPVEVMSGVKAVSCGHSHTAILKTDGTLWMCGDNENGQLGDGTTTNRITPVKVMSGVRSVSCGLSNTGIIKTDGTLWMCGRNENGELGDGTNIDRSSPVRIMSGVKSVSLGDSHTAVVKEDGTLWMCGDNSSGQLGDGTIVSSRYTPVKIMSGVRSVSCGLSTTDFIKMDGTLWRCKADDEIGDDGELEHGVIPKKVMGGVRAVATDMDYSVIIKTDGTLLFWGENYSGLFGIASFDASDNPVEVMSGVAEVSCNNGGIGILKTDGTLWMCGYNSIGQLGDGTTTDRKYPVKIMG